MIYFVNAYHPNLLASDTSADIVSSGALKDIIDTLVEMGCVEMLVSRKSTSIIDARGIMIGHMHTTTMVDHGSIIVKPGDIVLQVTDDMGAMILRAKSTAEAPSGGYITYLTDSFELGMITGDLSFKLSQDDNRANIGDVYTTIEVSAYIKSQYGIADVVYVDKRGLKLRDGDRLFVRRSDDGVEFLQLVDVFSSEKSQPKDKTERYPKDISQNSQVLSTINPNILAQAISDLAIGVELSHSLKYMVNHHYLAGVAKQLHDDDAITESLASEILNKLTTEAFVMSDVYMALKSDLLSPQLIKDIMGVCELGGDRDMYRHFQQSGMGGYGMHGNTFGISGQQQPPHPYPWQTGPFPWDHLKTDSNVAQPKDRSRSQGQGGCNGGVES